eukprot:PhM_4_TR1283/c1_g1_i2/m.7329
MATIAVTVAGLHTDPDLTMLQLGTEDIELEVAGTHDGDDGTHVGGADLRNVHDCDTEWHHRHKVCGVDWVVVRHDGNADDVLLAIHRYICLWLEGDHGGLVVALEELRRAEIAVKANGTITFRVGQLQRHVHAAPAEFPTINTHVCHRIEEHGDGAVRDAVELAHLRDAEGDVMVHASLGLEVARQRRQGSLPRLDGNAHNVAPGVVRDVVELVLGQQERDLLAVDDGADQLLGDEAVFDGDGARARHDLDVTTSKGNKRLVDLLQRYEQTTAVKVLARNGHRQALGLVTAVCPTVHGDETLRLVLEVCDLRNPEHDTRVSTGVLAAAKLVRELVRL